MVERKKQRFRILDSGWIGYHPDQVRPVFITSGKKHANSRHTYRRYTNFAPLWNNF